MDLRICGVFVFVFAIQACGGANTVKPDAADRSDHTKVVTGKSKSEGTHIDQKFAQLNENTNTAVASKSLLTSSDTEVRENQLGMKWRSLAKNLPARRLNRQELHQTLIDKCSLSPAYEKGCTYFDGDGTIRSYDAGQLDNASHGTWRIHDDMICSTYIDAPANERCIAYYEYKNAMFMGIGNDKNLFDVLSLTEYSSRYHSNSIPRNADRSSNSGSRFVRLTGNQIMRELTGQCVIFNAFAENCMYFSPDGGFISHRLKNNRADMNDDFSWYVSANKLCFVTKRDDSCRAVFKDQDNQIYGTKVSDNGNSDGEKKRWDIHREFELPNTRIASVDSNSSNSNSLASDVPSTSENTKDRQIGALQAQIRAAEEEERQARWAETARRSRESRQNKFNETIAKLNRVREHNAGVIRAHEDAQAAKQAEYRRLQEQRAAEIRQRKEELAALKLATLQQQQLAASLESSRKQLESRQTTRKSSKTLTTKKTITEKPNFNVSSFIRNGAGIIKIRNHGSSALNCRIEYEALVDGRWTSDCRVDGRFNCGEVTAFAKKTNEYTAQFGSRVSELRDVFVRCEINTFFPKQ